MRTEPRRWIISLPYTRPPLNLNDRMHWARKAKIQRELRGWTKLAAQTMRIPTMRHVTIELHYYPTTRRKRDADNLYATVKPCADGLVDAHVVADDDTSRVTHLQPVIEEPRGKVGRLELYVYEGRP